ncbi:glycosyltransferase family 1 protein [Desulfuromonas sp. AOP6]|uniref:glycosyltransferase family 4 protein n=1 Tax=Desulfuromonas sp. AOP6 TaxID=1566351 RepID=UPI001275B3D7|nr:glycosyltransferase family 1 protein [Desulfuromonas sp. AOP6]BCA80081.1 glycosyl transferase [Desulfuromonas sp. AOP6]
MTDKINIDKKNKRGLKIGIDAINLRRGGGITHLVEVIKAVVPENNGIKQIIVWGGNETLTKLPDRPWLRKYSSPSLNKSLLNRILWQKFILPRKVRNTNCDVLFVPGGSYGGNFKPVVTMSRNLLPFEWRELKRYGVSFISLKLLLLRIAQTFTYRHADGVIFLTDYARKTVLNVTGPLNNSVTTIPHGLNPRFKILPKVQHSIDKYSDENPYRLVYVSIIEPYKHQWHVVEAVNSLRSYGFPVHLDLVGPAYPAALKRLNTVISERDPRNEWVHYHGAIPYEELHHIYEKADLGVFASSCENMPNILLETMAAGLPVACSNRGPMPEILGEAGLYFDPEDPINILSTIKEYILSPELRDKKASASFERSKIYSWERCANETFSFISTIAK